MSKKNSAANKYLLEDNKAISTHESKVIYMQSGWSRVKQTVGPKHTNTSGEYSTRDSYVAPDASTWPNKHTYALTHGLKCVPRLDNDYTQSQQPLFRTTAT